MLKSNFSFFFKNFKIINSNKKLNQNLFNFRTFASKAELEDKLNQLLKIEKLEVIDMSGNCGTSFQIKIKSPDFNGKTMIAQHRMINDILKDELKDIHALQLKTEASNTSK